MINTPERGFTLIELLVVAMIVGILGTLVAMTYSGVQAKNRNAERRVEINSLQSHLEAYYVEHSTYPSLKDLNTSDWRKTNLKDFSDDLLSDPRWKDTLTQCTGNNVTILADSPTEGCYAYQATTADGNPCLDEKSTCAQYSLTALFEGNEKYVKTSLN